MYGSVGVGWLEGSENFVDAFYGTRCFSDGVELIVIEEGQSMALVYEGTDLRGLVQLPEEARSGCQVHFGQTVYLMRCGRSGQSGDEVMVAVDRETLEVVAELNAAGGNDVVESVFEVSTHRRKRKQLLVVTQRRANAQVQVHPQQLQEVHVVREDKQRVRLESTRTLVDGRVVAANEECVVVLKESPININYNTGTLFADFTALKTTNIFLLGYYVNVELKMVDYRVGRVRWSRHSRTESREPFAPHYALAMGDNNLNRSTQVHLTDAFVLVSKSMSQLCGSVWDALRVDTGDVASEAEMRVADLSSVTLGNRRCFSACKTACARGAWMVTATDLSPNMGHGHGVGNRQDVHITNILDFRKITMEQPYHR